MNDLVNLLAHPHAINLELKLSEGMILAAMLQRNQSDLIQITNFSINDSEMELDLVLTAGFIHKSFQIRFRIKQIIMAQEQLYVDLEVQNEILMPLLSMLKLLKFSFIAMLEVDGKQVRINLTPQLQEALHKQDPALRNYIQHVRITKIKHEPEFLEITVVKAL
jgi:hypothetical protein